jgi:hypothetical protein
MHDDREQSPCDMDVDCSWRDIPGFPDYQASTSGHIRSRKSGDWKPIKASPHSKTGYLSVSLRVGGKYITRSVHRLIAGTFIGPAHGRDVNHINGDKQDNQLCNLEYLSRGDNHRHAYRTRLREPVGKKLSDDQVRAIAALEGVLTQKAIARRFGVCRATVYHIHKRHQHRRVLQAKGA